MLAQISMQRGIDTLKAMKTETIQHMSSLSRHPKNFLLTLYETYTHVRK